MISVRLTWLPHRIALIAALIGGLGASSSLHAQSVSAKSAGDVAAADNQQLATLASEDQRQRMGESVERNDAERVLLVLAELAKQAVRTPADRVNAAIVLQHSPAMIRDGQVVPMNPDHFWLAHLLARDAFDAGYLPARFLVAQTIDRYLSFTAGKQRYGTNRMVDLKTGREELVYIDRSVADGERARYGVPALADLLRRFPERSAPAAR